jgi:dTDP-4-amino-4,6-dideoxygalactose transaminase
MTRIKLFQVHKAPHTRYLDETLNSGFYAEGPRVAEFENRLTEFVGTTRTVTVNSGTSALYLALYMAGVAPGRLVITTPITSPATNISIPRLGGEILWADVDPQSGTICPASVGRLLDRYGDRVAAVIAVDWGGMPCDFDGLRAAIGGRAYLIEDAAHALCAE